MAKQIVEFIDMGPLWTQKMKMLVSASPDGHMVVEEDVKYPHKQGDYDPGMRHERSNYDLDCIIHRPAGGWFRRGDVIKVSRRKHMLWPWNMDHF